MRRVRLGSYVFQWFEGILQKAKNGDSSRSVEASRRRRLTDRRIAEFAQEEKTFRMGMCALMCLHLIGTSLAAALPPQVSWSCWHGSPAVVLTRHQYALMSAENGQKLRFAMRKVFPLGADAGLPRCHAWCHGHAGMVVRCGADGCVC